MSHAVALPSDHRSESLGAIQATCDELGAKRLAWEHDVAELFDEFDSLAVQLAMAANESGRKSDGGGRDESWLELAQQQESLVAQQQNSSLELSAMRQMIEQQTELLAAFVGAATQLTGQGNTSAATKARTAGKADPLVNAVQAEFAQTKASPASTTRSGGRTTGLGKAS